MKAASIFLTHRDTILEHGCLQALVLNLYNYETFPFFLAEELERMDAHCMAIAVGIMLAYHAQGSEEEEFDKLGKELWGIHAPKGTSADQIVENYWNRLERGE